MGGYTCQQTQNNYEILPWKQTLFAILVINSGEIRVTI